MAEELRKLRLDRKIPAKDMVEIIQQFHPKFDKTVLSKCEHGEEYGVRIRRDALNALYEKFAPDLLAAAKKERGGRHRLTKRIACRLKDDEYAALLAIIEQSDYETVQDWLTDKVRRYISKNKATERSHSND